MMSMMPSIAVVGAAATALCMVTAGSITIETVAWLRPGDWRRTRRSVHTWWPIILTCVLLVVGGPWVATPVLALLSLQVLREYMRLTLNREGEGEGEGEGQDRVLGWAVLAAVPVHYGIIWFAPAYMTVWIVGYALLVLPVVRMFSGPAEGLVTSVTRAQWGLLTAVWGLGHLAWASSVEITGVASADLIAFILLLTFSGDAMQWVWGKLFGRRLLVPTISPKKTWEGLIGGMVSVAAIGALTGPLIGLSPALGGVLGAVAVGIGLLGDLVISAIKRDAGAKDTGRLLPGQGGLLDRLDGVLFTAPVAVQILVALG